MPPSYNKIQFFVSFLGYLSGFVLILSSFLVDYLNGRSLGFGPVQTVIFTGGVLWLTLAWILKHKISSALFTNGVLVLTSCTLASVFVELTAPPVLAYFSPPTSVFLLEKTDEPIPFDPIRGYLLPQIPARFKKITFGRLEYQGAFKGNNFGFPDRDDWKVAKAKDEIRYAVIGDSFSAGQWLKTNWPDQVERHTEFRKQNIRLYNFSIDGGGLANWWSILNGLILRKKIKFDGIIFSIYDDDLFRQFFFMDHTESVQYSFGKSNSWNPIHFPKSASEAKKQLYHLPGSFQLSSVPFEKAYSNGKLSREILKQTKALRDTPSSYSPIMWLAKRIRYYVNQKRSPVRTCPFRNEDPARISLIDSLAQQLDKANIPLRVVVTVPSKEDAAIGALGKCHHHIEYFSSAIGARIWNGLEAFEGRTKKEIKSLYHPHDGHWNQQGSDVYAGYLIEKLKQLHRSSHQRLPKTNHKTS